MSIPLSNATSFNHLHRGNDIILEKTPHVLISFVRKGQESFVFLLFAILYEKKLLKVSRFENTKV